MRNSGCRVSDDGVDGGGCFDDDDYDVDCGVDGDGDVCRCSSRRPRCRYRRRRLHRLVRPSRSRQDRFRRCLVGRRRRLSGV